MIKYNFKYLILVILTFSFLISCNDNKENSVGFETGSVKVMLTNAPAIYDEVLIDIKEIMIQVPSDSISEDDPLSSDKEWITLSSFNQAVYNLLDFTNGLDTILTTEIVPSGTIKQIRLVLGDNNQIKKDGEYFSLKTPSGQQSGLKIKVSAQVPVNDTLIFWIDFDAARSIVEMGNDEYLLKPVIRVYTKDNTGEIQGVVKPAIANTLVMSVSAENDTISTYADTSGGGFMISGLKAGTYSLIVNNPEVIEEATLTDILVKERKKTMLDTITLNISN